MILTAFLRALAQLGDPRFLRVIFGGILLALLLLALGSFALIFVIGSFTPNSIALPWIGPIGGVHGLISWGAALLMLLVSVVLMVPVASVFVGLFLETVAQAVEDRHYPDLPAAFNTGFGTMLIDTVNFIGLLIAVNLVALLFYALAGPLAPLLFLAINGNLLGREYFVLVASRRIGRPAAKALRRSHGGQIWLAGTLMAAPLSIPLLNLIIPVLGVATFTHLFHQMARDDASEPVFP
jgi:CysZ protein